MADSLVIRSQPLVVVVAGPNGAGKSTAAPRLLQDALAVDEFVNADAIAAGLSAFRPESVAMAAGRLMLARIQKLGEARVDFAFETTLASRTFAPRLEAPADLGVPGAPRLSVAAEPRAGCGPGRRTGPGRRSPGSGTSRSTAVHGRASEPAPPLSCTGGYLAGVRQFGPVRPSADRSPGAW